MKLRVVVPLVMVALAVTGGAAFVVVDNIAPAASAPSSPVAVAGSRPPVLAALNASAPAPSAHSVTAAVEAAAKQLPAGERVSGLVIDATTGLRLWSEGPRTPAAPASTLKLLTAAAALRTLGPTFRFTTTTRASGHVVYLVGSGDPTLTLSSSPRHVPAVYPPTATLVDLASRTAARLPRGRPVRVRVDASAWPPQGLGRGWSTDYVAEGDVTPPTALELDGGRLRPSDFDSPRTADPARQAGQAFVRLLREDGVRIRGPVSFARVPPAARSLAAVSSAPLGELVQRMLTESDNDLAEALGRAVARKAGLPPTFTGEARAIAEALAGLGVRSSELSLQDASGLSHDDRVAPTSLVAVLRAAAGGSDGRLGPILDGLPVAGFTGTLADRYRHKADKPGAGVVRAKTGSLTGVNALAGLVVDRAGRLLGFAVLAAGSTDRDVVEAGLDKIAASLAQLT